MTDESTGLLVQPALLSEYIANTESGVTYLQDLHWLMGNTSRKGIGGSSTIHNPKTERDSSKTGIEGLGLYS